MERSGRGTQPGGVCVLAVGAPKPARSLLQSPLRRPSPTLRGGPAALSHSRAYPLQYSVQVVQHLFISTTKDLDLKSFQNFVALSVILFLLIMHRTIHFHYQASFVAVEVHDEATDNLLPAKVQAIQLMAA